MSLHQVVGQSDINSSKVVYSNQQLSHLQIRQLDPHANNGDFITNPQFTKVSHSFQFQSPLNDSECSESYDSDFFFEGKYPNPITHVYESEQQAQDAREQAIQQQSKNPEQQQQTLQNIEIDMKHESPSIVQYIEKLNIDQEREPLKLKIKEHEFMNYFNYGLSTSTWNLLINKQIYMKFERLFIEKQINEREKRERDMLYEIEQLKSEIANCQQKRQYLEEMDIYQEVQAEIQRSEQALARQMESVNHAANSKSTCHTTSMSNKSSSHNMQNNGQQYYGHLNGHNGASNGRDHHQNQEMVVGIAQQQSQRQHQQSYYKDNGYNNYHQIHHANGLGQQINGGHQNGNYQNGIQNGYSSGHKQRTDQQRRMGNGRYNNNSVRMPPSNGSQGGSHNHHHNHHNRAPNGTNSQHPHSYHHSNHYNQTNGHHSNSHHQSNNSRK